MKFSQIQHCSVVVSDLDRAAALYRDIVGLTEVELPATFNPQHPRAIQVDDVRTARAWMKDHGLEVEETILIPGADRFFVRDPDHNLIEIIEWKVAYPNLPVHQ